MPDSPRPLDFPLPVEGCGSFAFWQKEASRSADWWKSLSAARQWDQNLQAYLGKSLDSVPDADTVVVPKDYANVEQKKALLFFQVPEVTLSAKQPNVEAAIPLFQAVLNRKLSNDDVNAAALMDEVLFDVLCVSGIAASKIGYEADIDGETQSIDPATGQPAMVPDPHGAMDPMTGQPAQMPAMVPNIVKERYFWNRIPVKRVLIPADFHGADFDRAPWLGWRGEMDLAVAARTYGLDKDDLKPRGKDDDLRLKSDTPHESAVGQKVEFTEIWYQASRYLPDVVNSDLYYQVVWIDGIDAPVVSRPSPYQTVTNGRLTGGMVGNPIHILTLRYVSDQAVPPSDVSMSRPLVDEMNEGRTQMVRQRKRTNPVLGYDPGIVDKTAIDKVVTGETQEAIAVPGWNSANQPIGEIRRASFPRENFSFNDYTARDIQEVWAMGSNQQGVSSQSKQTATEASIQQSATQTRMKREQTQVARWFVNGVQKLGALIQMFADEPDYVEVVGPDGAKVLATWDKTTIQGRFAYTAKPDSSLQMDAAFDKKNALDEYQFFRKDPLINPQYLITRIARRIGADPQQFLAQPQPPQPPPVTPSFAFTGDDLNPANPQFQIVMAVLQHGGIQIPPQAVQQAQQQAVLVAQVAQLQAQAEQQQANTEHGGMQPEAEPLNKHQSDQSGKLPGLGMAGAVQ